MTLLSSPPISCKPRAVAINRGLAWLLEGFGYFQKDALAWMGVTLLMLVITLVLAFLKGAGGLISTVLTPVFIAGLMLGCHARSQGGSFQVAHLFAGFSQRTGQLLLVGLLYLAGMIIFVIFIVMLVIFSTGGVEKLAEYATSDASAITDKRDALLVVLVAMALYVPLLMAFWFAPALVILRHVNAVDALKLSFNGCLMNIMPLILYGIIGLVLGIAAIIPMGLGFLVLLPVVTASMYVAYQDIFPAA